ncbi:hypothetical protein HY635_03230 [Candidatus Uhrbacteria bacterium]|nr:hypothetical protein [Candidatus Uhrbacteria bacterium]
MRRSYLLIITLLSAAVAGAQPAPTQPRGLNAGTCNGPNAPAECPSASRLVELHDPTLDRKMTCVCQYSDNGANVTCERCTMVSSMPRPTIRVVPRGKQTPAQKQDAAVWPEVIERFLNEGRARDLLGELEIRTDDDGFGIEFVLTCRNKPNDRRYKSLGITMPQLRDPLVRVISEFVERECAPPAPVGTNAWGCPVADEHDRSQSNRTANPKIRLIARVNSRWSAWERLRLSLSSDELIYTCARELLIDPVNAEEMTGDEPTFRANVTLVCANDPTKREEFDNGAGGMGADVLRRWLHDKIKRACGLKPSAAASR